MCQHSTTRNPTSSDMVQFLPEHFGDHQHHTVRRNVEALGVFLRVFTDHGARGDLTTTVDDGVGNTAVTPDRNC